MSTIIHDDVLFWPNGLGETPCTQEYTEIKDQLDAILDPSSFSLSDLSPDDYELWNRLVDKLAQLQMAGHLGKGYRYDGKAHP